MLIMDNMDMYDDRMDMVDDRIGSSGKLEAIVEKLSVVEQMGAARFSE
jgi:hypothetical protein